MLPKTSNRKVRYLVSSVALCVLSIYLMSSFLSIDFKVVELVLQNETYRVEKEIIKHRGVLPRMVRKRSTTTPKYVTTTPSSTSTLPPTTTMPSTTTSSTTTIPSTTIPAITTATSSTTTSTQKPSTPTTVHQSSTTAASQSKKTSATTVKTPGRTIQSTSRSLPTVSTLVAKVTSAHTPTTSALTTITTTAKTIPSTKTVSKTSISTTVTRAPEPKPTKSNIKDKMVLSFKSHELSKRNHDILIDLIKVFIAVADAHNWTYFMYGGTNIGSIRHHGIIPWDDDVDFFINTTHVAELKEVFKKMEPNYTVHDRGNDPILKLFSSESTICPRTHCKWKWPFVDLCFFAENNSHIWDTNSYFSHKKLKKTDLFPVHLRPFEGMWIKAARLPLRMIQVIYGVSDVCKTHPYDHAKEAGRTKVYSVTCERLKDVYPFVFRRWVDGKMEETLRLGDEILDIQLVDHELPSMVTKPYSTLPINGF